MFKHAFQPGSTVPKDATYWVHHYQHRISHAAFLRGGQVFPECIKCGHRVRFELSPDQQQAELISTDVDFPSDQAAAG
jgi:hypothetical protein